MELQHHHNLYTHQAASGIRITPSPSVSCRETAVGMRLSGVNNNNLQLYGVILTLPIHYTLLMAFIYIVFVILDVLNKGNIVYVN